MMYCTVRSLLATSILILLSGCWNKDPDLNKPQTAEEKQAAAKLIVVNVLSKDLYDDAHIKGSLHADFPDDLIKQAQQWDKSTPVVVYCSNYRCSASKAGARSLRKLGFEHVSAYEGGMAEWHQLSQKDPSYQVEGPAKLDYLSLVIPKPTAHDEDIVVISAEQLRDMLRTAAGV